MGNKCICWLRGSTDKQEIESQKIELTELAIKKYNFLSEDIIYIGKAGASAIKQNDLYQQEVNELISTLDEDKTIKFCFVWEISRLARVELAFYKMKNYFIENKIQLVCCVPSFKLFEEDGTINPTTEITLSVLITLANQEMKIKMQRFRRGRERNRKEMKFNGGGWGALYGYKVDDNGYIVPCKEEAEIVNLIYNLYATGKYSTVKLTKEIADRGYLDRTGIKFTLKKIQKILNLEAYKGGNDFRKYIPLVDEETWNTCAEIRKQNDTKTIKYTKENRYIHFAVKHLKCRECGGNYTCDNDQYKCFRHYIKQCDCSDVINATVLDNIIWYVAQLEHIDYLATYKEKSVISYKEDRKVLIRKIDELQTKLKAIEDRKIRIQDLYMNGDITKERYEAQKGKIIADNAIYQSQIDRYEEEIHRIESTIFQIEHPDMEAIISLIANIQDEEGRKKIKEIIDQHIGDIYIKKCTVDKYLAKEIEINTVNGEVQRFAYAYKGHKVYRYSTLSQKWVYINDKLFERPVGTTTYNELKEETETVQQKIMEILNDDSVNKNDKTFLLSVLTGKDMKEELGK